MNYLILFLQLVCEMRARVILTILQMEKRRHRKIVTGLKTQLGNGGARIQAGLASGPRALMVVDAKGCKAERSELGSHLLFTTL